MKLLKCIHLRIIRLLIYVILLIMNLIIIVLFISILFYYIGSKITALRISPDGMKIAVGDSGREIKVWEIGNDVPVITRKWMSHQSTVTTIAWSPDGDRLVSGSVDGKLIIWNMNTPRQINERPATHPGGIFCVEWPSTNTIYSCGDDACVREIELSM